MKHAIHILALALAGAFGTAQAAPPGQLTVRDVTRNYAKAIPPQHGLPVAGTIPVFTSVNGIQVLPLVTWVDPDGSSWYVQCANYTDGSPQQCIAILPVSDMRGLVPSTGLSNDGMYVVTYFRWPKGQTSDDEATRLALMQGTFSALYGQVLGQLGLPPSAVTGLARARAPGDGGKAGATGSGNKAPDDPDPAGGQGVTNNCDPNPEIPCIPVTGHPDDPPDNQPSPLPSDPPADNPPPGGGNGGGGGGGGSDTPDGSSWKKAITQTCIVAPIPGGPPLGACSTVIVTAPKPPAIPDDTQPPPPVPFDWCKNAGFCGPTAPVPPPGPGTGTLICASKWVVDSAFCIHNRLRLHQTQEKENECMAEKLAGYADCRRKLGIAAGFATH